MVGGDDFEDTGDEVLLLSPICFLQLNILIGKFTKLLACEASHTLFDGDHFVLLFALTESGVALFFVDFKYISVLL